MSTRESGALALVSAARDYSTAAVVLHGAVAERFGLGPVDLKALDVLQRQGPLSAGDIASCTGLASASVTSLVDRLVKKRLVRRRRDRRDRRRVIVELAPRMERMIAPLFASMNHRMIERFKRYKPAEVALIQDFLRRGAAEMRDEALALADKE